MSRNLGPNLKTLEKIARALDVPINRFFDRDVESPLDVELRRRMESSLQALMKRMPTMSRAEVREEMLAILSRLTLK